MKLVTFSVPGPLGPERRLGALAGERIVNPDSIIGPEDPIPLPNYTSPLTAVAPAGVAV